MLKMVTDDDTPREFHGARRILYAMAPYETPEVRQSIKRKRISFGENGTTDPKICKRSL
jgi:hypothetical protein